MKTLVTLTLALAFAAPAHAADATTIRTETHNAFVTAPCSTYALEYHRRLTAAGIPSRLIVVQATPSLYDSHTFNEVRKDGRWVIQDPTFDGYWTLNGRMIGITEMQRELKRGTWRNVRFVGPQQPMRDYYVDPRLLMRTAHIQTMRADGSWAKTTATVPGLHALYFASKTRQEGAIAGVTVHAGPGLVDGYELFQLPDARWVTPIHVEPTGAVLWVPRYR